MKYQVRNEYGQLTFESFGAVEQAWLQGLVGPEDEVLEEGSTRWRKAGTIPLLVQARRKADAAWGGTQGLWIVTAIFFGSTALYLVVKGHWVMGLALALGLTFLLTRVTYRAFTRTRPHNR
jgi:hypothetical protein